MNKNKILIIGGYGFLGTIVNTYLKKKNLTLKFKKKILKNNSIFFLNKLISYRPNIVINLAAETNVDLCEKNKNIAIKSNFESIKEIAKMINIYEKKYKKNLYLIHISTDQVYSGKELIKNKENLTNPINFYGKSKLMGEYEALKCNSIILRLNFIGYNFKKKGLLNWAFNNISNNKYINGFDNIIFNPLHTSTICKIINLILKKKINGIFNVGSKNSISKFKLLYKFTSLCNMNKKLILKKNYKKLNNFAKRPLNMSLNVSNFEKKFKFKLPNTNIEIIKASHEFKKNKNKSWFKNSF